MATVAEHLPESTKRAIRGSPIYAPYLRLANSTYAKRLRLRKQILTAFPYWINIELTNRCNLKCTYCPRPKMTHLQLEDMDLSLFKRIVDAFSAIVTERTTFTPVGLGEPLMYRELPEALKYLKVRYPMVLVHIDTNGTLLNRQKSEMLCRSLGSGDALLVSLNAGSPITYSKLNGAAKYELVVDNIRTFLQIRAQLRRGPTLSIQLLETGITAGEVQSFREFWTPLITEGDAICIKPIRDWAGRVQVEEYASDQQSPERYPCLTLWKDMVFDVDGNVYPCCQGLATKGSDELLLGNIQGRSLKEIYSGNRIRQMRREHLKGRWHAVPECSRCKAWDQFPNIWFKIGRKWM